VVELEWDYLNRTSIMAPMKNRDSDDNVRLKARREEEEERKNCLLGLWSWLRCFLGEREN